VIAWEARQKGSGSVVTSDRQIRRAVVRFGAIAVSAGEFCRILQTLHRGVERRGRCQRRSSQDR
jgi:predicted RNA-binding protein with PIN domain